MSTISVSRERLNKVLEDMEILIDDVSSLLNQDDIVKKRIEDVKSEPSIGKSEEELDEYIKKRGVLVD